MLTREAIVNHEKVTQYLSIDRMLQSVADWDIPTDSPDDPNRRSLMFLALLADIMRADAKNRAATLKDASEGRFCFLETTTGEGTNLCALSYHLHGCASERYASIGRFDCEEDLARADRNVRNFGLRSTGVTFAIFSGNPCDDELAARAVAFLRTGINMLFIDGADRFGEGVEADFDKYSDDVNPGGIVVISDYNNGDTPSVTESVDALGKEGWNVIGPLAPNARVGPLDPSVEVTKDNISPSVSTLYVMQKQ